MADQIEQPICPRCDKLIVGDRATILGITYHVKCFNCNHCGANLSKGFHSTGTHFYCNVCYLMFVPKCEGCGEVVGLTKYLQINDTEWHVHCFVCQKCKKPFGQNGAYYELNGKPYCLDDYWKTVIELQATVTTEQNVVPLQSKRKKKTKAKTDLG